MWPFSVCAFLCGEPEGCEGWEIEFGIVNRDGVAAAVDWGVGVDDEFVVAFPQLGKAISFLWHGGEVAHTDDLTAGLR